MRPCFPRRQRVDERSGRLGVALIGACIVTPQISRRSGRAENRKPCAKPGPPSAADRRLGGAAGSRRRPCLLPRSAARRRRSDARWRVRRRAWGFDPACGRGHFIRYRPLQPGPGRDRDDNRTRRRVRGRRRRAMSPMRMEPRPLSSASARRARWAALLLFCRHAGNASRR